MTGAAHLPRAFQVPTLAAHHDRRVVYAAFVFAASAVSIGAITALAYATGHPLVVPSLGPTAFLVFNRSNLNAARPRNILVGHLIGAAAGYVALATFGLLHAPSVVDGGLTSSRIGAAALSIALTSAVMILLRAEHGPAGATTLIVSLGFMTTPASLGLLMAGVLCLAVLGVAIDRSVGLQLPLWGGEAVARRNRTRPRPPAPPADGPATTTTAGNGKVSARVVALRGSALKAVNGPAWLIGPDQGRRITVGTSQCTVKVADAHTGGAYSLLEVVLDPSRPSTLLHAHYDFAETYFVLEGEVMAEIGTERHKVPAGSTISVPAGTVHLLCASGRTPARCLCVTERARHSDLEYLP